VKLWRVRCTRCGIITENRPAAYADVRAELHRKRCKGTPVVERQVK
jgi:hypothetical protein